MILKILYSTTNPGQLLTNKWYMLWTANSYLMSCVWRVTSYVLGHFANPHAPLHSVQQAWAFAAAISVRARWRVRSCVRRLYDETHCSDLRNRSYPTPGPIPQYYTLMRE